MKKFLSGALALMLTFSLAACGGKNNDTNTDNTEKKTEAEATEKPSEPEKETEKEPEKTEQKETEAEKEPEQEERTITMLIQQSRNFEGLQNMIAKLEDEEKIITDAQVVPDDEALNMIKMKLNSGEAPDLIEYNVPAIYDIVDPAANFADMSGEAWAEKLIIPGNVTCHADGKIYGFPFLSVPGTHGFIYNKDVFSEAGITEEPETWDELLEACEKIKAIDIVPIYMPKDSWVPQILMTDNFAKILGPEGAADFADKVMKNETKWTDHPEFFEVIDTYLKLYEDGYVNDNFTSATYDDAIAAVANGEAAMHFNGDFFAASVLQANEEANVGMFPLSMSGENEVVSENMSSAGFVAYKNSENLETVKEVLNLWAAPEYCNLYFENRPAFPAFKDVDGGPVPSYLENINEDYIKTGKAIPEFNYYVMDLNALCESTLYVYYVDAPAKGNMDGQEIMEKFQKDFEQYMADQDKPGF